MALFKDSFPKLVLRRAPCGNEMDPTVKRRRIHISRFSRFSQFCLFLIASNTFLLLLVRHLLLEAMHLLLIASCYY